MGKSPKIALLFIFIPALINAQKQFMGNPSKAHYTMYISKEAYYQKYNKFYEDVIVINSQTKDKRIKENSLELFIANQYPNSKATHIQLVHKLTFNNLGKEFMIIKFYELKNKVIVSNKVLVFSESANIWVESKQERFEDLIIAIKYMKPDYFEKFYYGKTSDIEIEKIKEPFTSPQGWLDSHKFAKYLRTKPKEMEKYCDL